MKRENQIQKKGKIIFKRWSRKAYAIFATLNREIVIERVCKSIAEKSLTKSNSLQKNDLLFFSTKNEESDVFSAIDENEVAIEFIPIAGINNSKAGDYYKKEKELNIIKQSEVRLKRTNSF